jgi:hypothetical protein
MAGLLGFAGRIWIVHWESKARWDYQDAAGLSLIRATD